MKSFFIINSYNRVLRADYIVSPVVFERVISLTLSAKSAVNQRFE